MMTVGEFQLAQRFVKAFEAIALAQAKLAGVAGRAESRHVREHADYQAELEAEIERDAGPEAEG